MGVPVQCSQHSRLWIKCKYPTDTCWKNATVSSRQTGWLFSLYWRRCSHCNSKARFDRWLQKKIFQFKSRYFHYNSLKFKRIKKNFVIHLQPESVRKTCELYKFSVKISLFYFWHCFRKTFSDEEPYDYVLTCSDDLFAIFSVKNTRHLNYLKVLVNVHLCCPDESGISGIYMYPAAGISKFLKPVVNILHFTRGANKWTVFHRRICLMIAKFIFITELTLTG